jgi:V/A-type H+-transporting ATPase subunit I
MIVGDIGYGLIMLGIVFWLRLKFKDNEGIQLATSILGPAATAVVAFGIVYAEFFGNLLTKYFNVVKFIEPLPGLVLPFHRVVLVKEFMYLAVAVGVVQVLLGLTFGVVNAVRTKNKHHLYEKGGVLVFFVALFAAVLIGFIFSAESWSIWPLTGFALLSAAGFVYALRGGGVMGFVETLESVSGMASYIRIMAVGLAGAIFADAINQIVLLAMGGENITAIGVVLGLIIGILLHGLSFLIAAFSPTIHALRLNFLEFFGRFYEVGTKEYSPFHKTGGEGQA